jgi:hypothetical protein
MNAALKDLKRLPAISMTKRPDEMAEETDLQGFGTRGWNQSFSLSEAGPKTAEVFVN